MFNRRSLFFILAIAGLGLAVNAEDLPNPNEKQVIKNIVVQGNKHIKEGAILKRLPYKKGGLFDVEKTGEAINLLYGLGHFRQIRLEKEALTDKEMKLRSESFWNGFLLRETSLFDRVKSRINWIWTK